jgi:hypothetical protein
MPYRIRKSGRRFCVYSPKKRLGCHPTKAAAIRQLRAVYAHTKGK